jgi:anti-sigma regulatory factor (Ser/Thr protein kinase)
VQDSVDTGLGQAELRVRLAADPASVPGVRRFVSDCLVSWGVPELVDDATLCVSELAGNAVLHSASTFMEISMLRIDDVVRISVQDDGIVPPDAVVPRSSLPIPGDDPDDLLDNEATTGRGLAIVSMLATDWGVDTTTGGGKRIWVDVADGGDEFDVRPPRTGTGPDLEEGREARPAGALPPGWVLVRLVGCPVGLSLRQDEHLDELIRELQLLAADGDNPRSRVLALELQGLLSGPAHARHTGRRIAQQAAAAGLDHIDVDMAMPREFSGEVQKLHKAVRAADVLCEEMRLLTLASSAELRALRAWMTDQLVGQLQDGAEPVSWQEWLRRHG